MADAFTTVKGKYILEKAYYVSYKCANEYAFQYVRNNRSVKTVMDFRGTRDYTDYAFTAEFGIE